MTYKVTFYNVIDTITGEMIEESRDAYYLAEKLGVSCQLLISYFAHEKLIHNRFLVVKDESLEVSFPPEFRYWFVAEWKKMQDMFHVKHS